MSVSFKILSIGIALFLLSGCTEKPMKIAFSSNTVTEGRFVTYDALSGWNEEDHAEALALFRQTCLSKKSMPEPLVELCNVSKNSTDAKHFFEANFQPFLLHAKSDEEKLLTGYYEPQFKGSLHPSDVYAYPLYKRPKDLLDVELGAVASELQKRTLYGRLEGRKVVPYYTRREINQGRIGETPLCYLQSDVDRFFLQVQGSGRVLLENNATIYLGYDGQNGHPYRSIGKLLVANGDIAQEDISLASIRIWLQKHPESAKKVLESNPSFVFFDRRGSAATGSFGVVLRAMRSVAVDRTKIPQGYPLFLSAENPLSNTPINRIVYAHDTGGAIKGQVRADLFCGFGEKAQTLAGQLRSPLRLYLLVPKKMAELTAK